MRQTILTLYFLLACFLQLHAENVVKITDITHGGSEPHGLTVFNNKLFFGATASDGKKHLYATDGTPAGTKQIGTNDFTALIKNGIVFNNKLFFTTVAGGNNVICATDGSTITTVYSTTPDVLFYNFKVFNDKLFFLLRADGSRALYLIDMSNQVQSLGGLTNQSLIETTDYVVFGNKLFFNNGAIDNELWVSDLTQGGTHIVKDICTGGSSNPSSFYVFNDRLYFSAEDQPAVSSVHNFKPWVTNGSDTGTHILEQITPNSKFNIRFVASGSKLFFITQDFSQKYDLWVGNGTVNNMDSIAKLDYMGDPFAYNDSIYFAAGSGGSTQLWVSDGTVAGTQLVWGNYICKNPHVFTIYHSKMYFLASSMLMGNQIWGATLGLSTLISPVELTSQFCEYNGGLYFEANFDLKGYELWRMDPFGNVVKDVEKHAFNVYPNPAHNSIRIETPEPANFVLTDMFGRQVLKADVAHTATLDISTLKPGVYILSDNAGNQERIIKQ